MFLESDALLHLSYATELDDKSNIFYQVGCAMSLAVSHQPFTVETGV